MRLVVRFSLLMSALWLALMVDGLIIQRRTPAQPTQFLGMGAESTMIASIAGAHSFAAPQIPFGAWSFVPTPDRSRAAFVESGDVYILDMHDRGVTRITNTPNATDTVAGWSADGTWLLYSTVTGAQTGMTQVRFDGTQARALTGLGERSTLLEASTGGQWAYLSTSGLTAGLFLLNLNSGYAQRLTDDAPLVLSTEQTWEGTVNHALLWSRDRRWMFFSAPDECCVRLYRLSRGGQEFERIIDEPHNAYWVSLSPDGNWVYVHLFAGVTADIYRVRLDGSELQQLTTYPGEDQFMAWSPDGAWMIYQSEGNLYRMRPDGSSQQQLTTSRGNDVVLGWSGEWLVYRNAALNQQDSIWRMRVDGSGQQRLAQFSHLVRQSYWSPDNNRLLLLVNDGLGDGGTLYSLQIVNGLLTQLSSDAAQTPPGWSPDGAWIQFHQHDPQGIQLYRIRPDGTGLHNYAEQRVQTFRAWLPPLELPWEPEILLGMAGMGAVLAMLLFLWREA